MRRLVEVESVLVLNMYQVGRISRVRTGMVKEKQAFELSKAEREVRRRLSEIGRTSSLFDSQNAWGWRTLQVLILSDGKG